MYEVGDVLFFCDEVVHPSIIVKHKGELRQVDMIEDGASVGRIQERSHVEAFRCRNQALAQRAADYALAWADETGWYSSGTNGAAPTPYASKDLTGCYYGWQAHRKSGETAPFEHDALYRAFKWASRKDDPLSREKGFTCDVFVCACFHAAAISLLYKADMAKIAAKVELLGGGRSEQKLLKPDRHVTLISPKSGTEFEKSVLRTWSNAGVLPAQDPSFLGHWKSVLNDCVDMPEALHDVFTLALLVDAKFTHGAQMLERMQSDEKWWQRIC